MPGRMFGDGAQAITGKAARWGCLNARLSISEEPGRPCQADTKAALAKTAVRGGVWRTANFAPGGQTDAKVQVWELKRGPLYV